MSDLERRSPASRALDALAEEAREHLDVPATQPDTEWSRLEARLGAIGLEPDRAGDRGIRDVVANAGGRASGVTRRLVGGGVVVLAAAAAVALFVRERPTPDAPRAQAAVEPARQPASSLRSIDPVANEPPVTAGVRVAGKIATPGYLVHDGDSIDLAGGRATFEQSRRVTWTLDEDAEGKARVHVKAAEKPLVLGLERGAVEAQVAPVSEGEAFAVDVVSAQGAVRVAVHGTHLRVARSGEHVVIDLSEGEIAIGVPPRTGVTSGTVVTAPAHVELDVGDLGSVRIDRAPSAVRPPIPLSVEGLVQKVVTDESSRGAALAPAATTPKSSSPRPVDTAAPQPKLVPEASLPPRDAIGRAVRDCAARVARPSEVRVTVTSNLRLRISASGVVETAQFSPPLQPEIQSCAATTIYKTKLDAAAESRVVTIPIEYSY